MNGRPVIVSIEGVDGVGKTTAIPLVSRGLEAEGLRCATLPEFPDYPPVRRIIDDALGRSLFVSDGCDVGDVASLFLMLFAFALNLQDLDYTADVVLLDRGLESVAVYQGAQLVDYDQRAVCALVRRLEEFMRSIGVPLAAHCFVLEAPMGLVIQRLERRLGRSIGDAEWQRLISIAQFYSALANSSPIYRRCDARHPVAHVARAITSAIIHVVTSQETSQ